MGDVCTVTLPQFNISGIPRQKLASYQSIMSYDPLDFSDLMTYGQNYGLAI